MFIGDVLGPMSEQHGKELIAFLASQHLTVVNFSRALRFLPEILN